MTAIRLSDEEWQAFRRHKAFRDECCLKIGVLEYEAQLLRQRYMQQIEHSLREEEAAAREIAARHAIDERAHWTITDAHIVIQD